jgi:tetratricopeptide (TPR) repeat protein
MSGELKDKAVRFFNAARSQQERGLFEDSLKNYLISLDIQEKLAKSDPFFNTWISTTLNNLGALLSDMGKPEDARNSYERALKMRESLLSGDPGNVVYQSQVAMTLNNLGLFMEKTGNFPDAKKYYEDSLRILKEPLHYMTIKAKSRAIINLIQLISKEADRETNLSTRQSHFKEIYEKNLLYASFFDKFKLEHEKHLSKEAGLTAHIHYLMLSARKEENKYQRIEEYQKCIQEVKKIDEDESDENLRELWSFVAYYLEGRLLINQAILSDIPDKELIRKAVEKFELAKERYKNAKVCHWTAPQNLDEWLRNILNKTIQIRCKYEIKKKIHKRVQNFSSP